MLFSFFLSLFFFVQYIPAPGHFIVKLSYSVSGCDVVVVLHLLQLSAVVDDGAGEVF